MNEASLKSKRTTCADLSAATGSLELPDGISPCGGQSGQQTDLSGPAPVPVSRFRALAKDRATPTSGTCGPLFTASSPSAVLQRSLESRLRARMDVNGSQEFALTWKTWDMPAGGADLCAAGVGAPHRRQRLYWVADSTGQQKHQEQPRSETDEGKRKSDLPCGCRASGRMAYAEHAERGQEHGPGEDGRNGEDSGRKEAHGELGTRGEVCSVADGESERRDRAAGVHRQDGRAVVEAGGGLGHATSLGHGGGAQDGPGQPAEVPWAGCEVDPVGHAAGRGCGVGGDAPLAGRGGHPERPSWAGCVTIQCLDGKARRVPAEPALFPLADGIPGRVGLLRGAGNAIVPEVAEAFVRAWIESQNMTEQTSAGSASPGSAGSGGH